MITSEHRSTADITAVYLRVNMMRLSFIVQNKTHTGLCVDELRVKVLVHLAPQIVDIHIDEVGSGIKVRVPYPILDIHAADNPTGILHKILQQQEFLEQSFMKLYQKKTERTLQ